MFNYPDALFIDNLLLQLLLPNGAVIFSLELKCFEYLAH